MTRQCPITDSQLTFPFPSVPEWRSDFVTQVTLLRRLYRQLLSLHPLTHLFRAAWRLLQAITRRILAYLHKAELKSTNQYQDDYRLAALTVKFANEGFPWGEIPQGMSPWHFAFFWIYGHHPERLIPIWTEYQHRYDERKPVQSARLVRRIA